MALTLLALDSNLDTTLRNFVPFPVNIEHTL